MHPLIIVGLIIIIGYVISKQYVSEVDVTVAMLPPPHPLAAETTVLSPQPNLSLVAPIKVDDSMVELYSAPNFKGTKIVLRRGMTQEFARRGADASLVWSYNSMKVVPGTILMFSSQAGAGVYRAYAVGKDHVVDMKAFFDKNESLRNCRGICMERAYWRNIPFNITVMSEKDWEAEANLHYSKCLDNVKKAKPGQTEAQYQVMCRYNAPSFKHFDKIQSGFVSSAGVDNAYGVTGPVFDRNDMIPY